MIRLFIENREIELDASVQFALTRQFENLSNPTSIINAWSKTVSIPFTAKNHETFGSIYRIDREIIAGGSIGVYFDPYKKLDFRLEWDNSILMSGYAKMNEIKKTGGTGTYEITLFGQLGKVFQEMQKITFDTTTSDTSYLINGELYIDDYIDYNLVFNNWNYGNQRQSKPIKKGQPDYSPHDIMGFAPNNSINEGFDYKTFQVNDNTSALFTDVLGDSFTEATGIEPNSVIPNGLMPREIGEYRSYLQLPYIYFNKLFQIFEEKAEAVTGYTFDLDPEWFNVNNPYWYKLVFMLKGFDTKKGETKKNQYAVWPYSTAGWQKSSSINTLTTHRTTNLVYGETYSEMLPMVDGSVTFNDGKWNIPANTTVSFKIDLNTQIYDMQGTNNPVFNANNAIFVRLKAEDMNGNSLGYETVVIKHPNCTLAQGYTAVEFSGSTKSGSTDKFVIPFYLNVQNRNNSVTPVRFRVESWCENGTYWPTTSNGSSGSYILTLDMHASNGIMTTIVNQGSFHSGSHFILNDLWNNEKNVFNEIINYCKMFRIAIYIDESRKKIIFRRYPAFFNQNTSIANWTDKVDKSKDFTIKPVSFEDKYILFNYEDNKTKLGEEYKAKYGVNYGDYRLKTEYNFNESTNQLFKGIQASICNTDNVLSWTNLYDNKQIMYSFPNEIHVYNKDKDNKYVDCFGRYYFYRGMRSFDTTPVLNLRTVHISDDTAFQQYNNNYFYTQSSGTSIQQYAYPWLDVVYEDEMCLFNIPSANYTASQNYANKNTIFSNFWSDYINERYNVQNKLITCYLRLDPQDYAMFEFNKFVLIGNQLCMVNKIYDFDVTSSEPTKVDLLTIQDVSGYRTDTYLNRADVFSLTGHGTFYFNGSEQYTPSTLTNFKSMSDVTFSDGSKTYTVNGVRFTISDDKVLAQNVSDYVDKADIDFSVTLKNKHNSDTFIAQRYSIYPYPWIILEDGEGNEVSTVSPGSRVYKLKWHGTPTETLANKPTITIDTLHASGSATIGNDWVENWIMVPGEGGDEYFRNEYEVSLNTNLTNVSNTYITITVTDKEGWHETRSYRVS